MGDVSGMRSTFNIPRTKGSLKVTYEKHPTGLTVSVGMRAVSSFPPSPAAGTAPIPGYGLVDFDVACPAGRNRNVIVSADVQNVFDKSHLEFAGAPMLGRLAVVRVRTTF